METKEFKPDWKSPPGDTINDILEERRYSLLSFSQKMRLTSTEVDGLFDGSTKITPEIARRLSETIGGTIGFWLERERRYRQ
jgi:HTH-type transcriptional regulator/antitoxin HigA